MKGIYGIRSERMRGGKIKSREQVRAVLKHNLRETMFTDHLDPNGSITVLAGPDSVERAMKRFDWIISHLGIRPTEGKSKMRNSIHATELMFSFSPEATDKIDTMAWSARVMEFAERKFGKTRILSAVLHEDEQTPHIQLLVVPVHKRRDSKLQLSQNHWFGTRKKCEQYQQQCETFISRAFGLQPRQKYSELREDGLPTPKHKDIATWRKEQAAASLIERLTQGPKMRALKDASKEEIAGLKRKMRKEIRAAKRAGQIEAAQEMQSNLDQLTGLYKREKKRTQGLSERVQVANTKLGKAEQRIEQLQAYAAGLLDTLKEHAPHVLEQHRPSPNMTKGKHQ